MDKKWNETKNKKLINASLRKLQSIAKQRGLKEYKKLDKIELLQLLDGSLGKYRAIAEQHGLRDYSKLNKKDLQQLVMGYESLLDMFPKGIARPTLKNKFIEWVNWLEQHLPEKKN